MKNTKYIVYREYLVADDYDYGEGCAYYSTEVEEEYSTDNMLDAKQYMENLATEFSNNPELDVQYDPESLTISVCDYDPLYTDTYYVKAKD